MDHDRTAPDHPDIVVSQAMAIVLIAAGEERDLWLLRNALIVATRVACWHDVVDTLADTGGARLHHMQEEHGINEIVVGPWTFLTEDVAGDLVWTYRLAETQVDAITADVQRLHVGDPDHVAADLHGVARTITAAANGADEDEVMAFWSRPETHDVAQIARLATCVGLMFADPDTS